MQRKPGFTVTNCNIKMPEPVNIAVSDLVHHEDESEQQQRRQQLINFGHSQWGFNNWNWSVNKQELDFVDFLNGKYCAGVVAFVSISVKSFDIHRENIGYATSVAATKGMAIYKSRKCAVTNALRETLLSFGGSVATDLLELPDAHAQRADVAPAPAPDSLPDGPCAHAPAHPVAVSLPVAVPPHSAANPPSSTVSSNHPVAATNHAVATSNHLPSSSNHPPISSNHPPVSSNHPPVSSNHPPVTSNHVPVPPIHPVVSAPSSAPIPKPMEQKNSPVPRPVPRKDSVDTLRSSHPPPVIKNVNPPPVAKAHPMPVNLPQAPRSALPVAPRAPAAAPVPPAPHLRPNSNVSFVLQPVMPPLYGPPRLAPPHVFPNAYYECSGPWHFTYESYDRPHGNVNLNFNIPPKNLVVNSRSGSVECKSACRPGPEGEPVQYGPQQNQGCWIKPTIFYDGFWTEQKVKKWVAEQVEKQFPEDVHKASSPATTHADAKSQ